MKNTTIFTRWMSLHVKNLKKKPEGMYPSGFPPTTMPIFFNLQPDLDQGHHCIHDTLTTLPFVVTMLRDFPPHLIDAILFPSQEKL